MTWEPQPEGLQQMIAILKQSQSPDTATQMAVQVVSTLLELFPFSFVVHVCGVALFALPLFFIHIL